MRQGLTLIALEEGSTLTWRFAPRMTLNDIGDYVWHDAESALVPCTFTVVARRD